MALVLHVLASGSKGNATIVEDSDSGRAILIDCGINRSSFIERCRAVGFNPRRIEGILLTHEHSDHTKGLRVLLRALAKKKIRPPIYTSTAIAQASREIKSITGIFYLQDLEEGIDFSCAGFRIYPFLTSHDSVQSFGFRVEDKQGDALGFITDSGIIPAPAREYLENCRILALESNYDHHMMIKGSYHFNVRKRIMSDKGHLSNRQAGEALESLLCNKLEQVIAMHISENNNTYRIPRETLEYIIARNTHSAKATTSFQYQATSVF